MAGHKLSRVHFEWRDGALIAPDARFCEIRHLCCGQLQTLLNIRGMNLNEILHILSSAQLTRKFVSRSEVLLDVAL